MGLSHIIWREQTSEDILRQSREINRRIANLLSSARLYLDHLRGALSAIHGPDASKTKYIHSLISEQFDGSASYRIMEALRNHVQHSDLAANSFSIGHSVTREKPNVQFACTVTPIMVKRDVLANKQLSSREDFERLPDENDLKPHIRKYMACLGRIHEEVRKQLREDYHSWETPIQEAVQQFKSHFANASTVGLAVVRSEAEMPSDVLEKQYVRTDIIELRMQLEKLNKVQENLLANGYVTGQQRDMIRKTRD